MWSDADTQFLLRAINLARRGIGRVEPNPAVGAVLVKKGKILAEGYHSIFGGDHAEILAIKNCIKAGISPKNSSLYVTLEPCSHFGKTPPCVDEIIKHKIKKVYIGSIDPSYKVKGKGIKKLKRAGIEVNLAPDDLKRRIEQLNPWFYKYYRKNVPWVICKWAQTVDGKLATRTGASKWITSESARKIVHKLRKTTQAIVVGANTVTKDNPSLTIRYNIKPTIYPKRVILDGNLRIRPDFNILKDIGLYPTLIFTSEGRASSRRGRELEGIGAKVIPSKLTEVGKIDIQFVFEYLAGIDCPRVFVEGGAELLSDIIVKDLADEIYVFVAPLFAMDEKAYQFRGIISREVVDFIDEYKIVEHKLIDNRDLLIILRRKE